MSSSSASGKGLRRSAALSIFSAVIAVLTVMCNFVRFGPFPITLALAPIIIGAALYGPSAGALLGGVFGVVTLVTGFLGWDGGTVMLLMSVNALACVLVCLAKSVLAGLFSGLIYKLAAKKSERAAVIAAGVICPVTNTGVFILGMLLFFASTLESWASGQGVLYYIIFGLTGINFLVELAVILLLSSGITTIIRYGQKRH